jgi:hypothetical protein
MAIDQNDSIANSAAGDAPIVVAPAKLPAGYCLS